MEIKLTYHAIKRYLERIEGVDLKPVFAEMRRLGYARKQLFLYLAHELGLTEPLLVAIIIPPTAARVMSGGDGYIKHNGHRFVIKSYALVSVVPAKF